MRCAFGDFRSRRPPFRGANIAAETIDSLQWPEVLGTIAGDNTILMIVRSVEEVRPVMERLNAMIRR